MSTQLSWPYHGSLTEESYASRVEDGLPVRIVEALNPRGNLVRDMRMCVKRSLLLDDLMSALHGELTPSEVAQDPYAIYWVQGAKKLAKEIWADMWQHHPNVRNWDITYQLWWDGSVRRSREALRDNLPESVKV